MPYITKTARQIIEEGGVIQTGGELNYAFTREIAKHLGYGKEELTVGLMNRIDEFVGVHGKSYTTFNTVLGALVGANLEYIRRMGPNNRVSDTFADVVAEFYGQIVGPYEDEKIKQNGDVY